MATKTTKRSATRSQDRRVAENTHQGDLLQRIMAAGDAERERREFAGLAMMGLLARLPQGYDSDLDVAARAKRAVRHADALIVALAEPVAAKPGPAKARKRPAPKRKKRGR